MEFYLENIKVDTIERRNGWGGGKIYCFRRWYNGSLFLTRKLTFGYSKKEKIPLCKVSDN
jgi:hypothetical protein